MPKIKSTKHLPTLHDLEAPKLLPQKPRGLGISTVFLFGLIVLIFNLFWYGRFLSFPLVGEDGASNFSSTLLTLKSADAFSLVFPYNWMEGLGQPQVFVPIVFDPFTFVMLLPLDPSDTFRISMALRATVCWTGSYLFAFVLFKGRKDLAVLTASLNMLMNFTLGHDAGVPTLQGIHNATLSAIFPFLLWIIYCLMTQPRWFGWRDLFLIALLPLFFTTYPIGSIIAYCVALAFAFSVFACAGRSKRTWALRGGLKFVLVSSALLFLPELGIWHSWSALSLGSARVVFSEELYAYAEAYRLPLYWRSVPIAVSVFLLLALPALAYKRRWPRPLRISLLVLLLVVGGTQFVTIIRATGLFSATFNQLPRPHYFEFYVPIFYATSAAFVLRYWWRSLPTADFCKLTLWREKASDATSERAIFLDWDLRAVRVTNLYGAPTTSASSEATLVVRLRARIWRRSEYLNLEARASRSGLIWIGGCIAFLAFATTILTTINNGLVLIGTTIAIIAVAILFATQRWVYRPDGRFEFRLLASNVLVLGIFAALSAGTWCLAPATIHPILAKTCTGGLFWCEDRAGATIGAAATPITEFLQRSLSSSATFSGRAETLLVPNRTFVFPIGSDVHWTPELFDLLKLWYRRAYEARPPMLPHTDNRLSTEPDTWRWEQRDELLSQLQTLAASRNIFFGILPEDLIAEIESWASRQEKANSTGNSRERNMASLSEVGEMVAERNRAFATTGNGMMLRALPMQKIAVASSYEQALDFLYYLFWTRFINEGGANKYVRSINFTALEVLHINRLALIGVRYVVARESIFEAPPPLPKVMSYAGYGIYEIPAPNVSGYSAHSVVFGKSIADELSILRMPNTDVRTTAVLPTTEERDIGSQPTWASMRDSSISLHGNELIFEAVSDGERSLAVLPFRFTSCLVPSWDIGQGRVVRANVGLVGLVFSGHIKVRLRWLAGYESTKCLKADLRLATEAKQAGDRFRD